MRYCVYIHTTPCNKKYVGITRRNPIKRWKSGYGYLNNDYFFKAIKKYGWDNIKHEVLYTNLTKEEAEKKEIELISFFDTTNREKGYNHTFGGLVNGNGFTEETKLKMRLSHLGKKTKPKTKTLKENHSKYMKEHWKEKEFRDKTMKALLKHHCKKVKCIETGKIFDSQKEAGYFYNISHKHIGECCKGIRKTTGGYHWEKVGGDYA